MNQNIRICDEIQILIVKISPIKVQFVIMF